MPGSVIKEGAVVEYAIVGENSVIEKNAHVGVRPETVDNRDDWGIAVIGHKVTIAEGQKVGPKEMVPDIRKK
jgi:glucose-1-phosphate adenylyltransferase